MTRIKQHFSDSGEGAIACKVRVTLSDLLVNYAADPDTVLLPEPRVFDVLDDGILDIELRESATQRVTYEFFVFVPEILRYYYLNNERYLGDTHQDSETGLYYTGIAPSPSRQQLSVIETVTERELYRFNAMVPDVIEVGFTELLGQAVTSARYVDRNFYSSVLLGLPGTDGALETLPNLTVLQASVQTLISRITSLEGELENVEVGSTIDQETLDRISALESLVNTDVYDVTPLLTRLAALENQVYNGTGGNGTQTPDTTPPTATPSPIQP